MANWRLPRRSVVVTSRSSLQADAVGTLVHNFPPKDLEAVVLVRDTLMDYAQAYPVSQTHVKAAGNAFWYRVAEYSS